MQAVDGVSFSVETGEFFGILGPNGAGKTTTLEIIEGLRAADGGSVSLLDESPWPRNANLLPRIGVQLQASAFFDRLTAREQIHTFAVDVRRARGEAATSGSSRVGLDDKADTRTEKLSGGQLQRLVDRVRPGPRARDRLPRRADRRARPAGAAQPLGSARARSTENGRTVVLTTHYMDEAEALCDRVAIMDHGKILQLDSPTASDPRTRRRCADQRRRRRVDATDDAAALRGVERVESTDESSNPDDPRAGRGPRRACASARHSKGSRSRSATLEDVFLTLTGREYRA